MSDLAVGRYRHYKGGEYTVMGVAQHSDKVGKHAQGDDIHVSNHVSDGTREYEEWQTGYHANCDCPSHEEPTKEVIIQMSCLSFFKTCFGTFTVLTHPEI